MREGYFVKMKAIPRHYFYFQDEDNSISGEGGCEAKTN